MMRRSGASPAVKRWKLSCEMLRRAASGHIEATQLSKFAAASRIALAVISGWPEAPSSALHGSGGPLAAGAPCAGATDGAGPPFEDEPLKMLPRKSSGPLPADCACATPPQSSAAASSGALVRTVDLGPVLRVMLHPRHPLADHGLRAPPAQRVGFAQQCHGG